MSEETNILFIAWKSEFSSQYNSVHSSAFIKVAAQRQMLRGSILTSLWSYPCSPWALRISLLKAFLIHLGNNWDQLEAALSGPTCIWKSWRYSTPIQSYNFLWQAVLKLHWQAQEDGFEGYRSSAEKLNHKVEQLWLFIRNMLWLMGCPISKWLLKRRVFFLLFEKGDGTVCVCVVVRGGLIVWHCIRHKNQGWRAWWQLYVTRLFLLFTHNAVNVASHLCCLETFLFLFIFAILGCLFFMVFAYIWQWGL